MEDKSLYLCDPRKQPRCRKIGCFFDGLFADCYCTKDPEKSVTGPDGNPLLVPYKDADFIEIIGGDFWR